MHKIDVTVERQMPNGADVFIHEVVDYDFKVNETVFLPYSEVATRDLDEFVEADDGNRLELLVKSRWLADLGIC